MGSDKDFTEYAASDVDQIQHPGASRIKLWRSVWRSACHEDPPRSDLQELSINLDYTDLGAIFEAWASRSRKP
jgi:hypothetical protein